MIHAAEVKRTVDDRLAQVLGARRADDDIPELPRTERLRILVHTEGEHVGGAVDPAVLAIELADPVLVHELDRDVAVLDPRRGERQRTELLDLHRGRTLAQDPREPDHLDVEHGA